ncbi:MAG: sigma-70 family RNA polymerase sigma factor [Myxococcales bacterium]|nr:sigma-70 family RNA polymerase sigma factor [Myxococcales bacterium]MCB9713455.1 sigma-70 family RNA polymerase sigma factor [Myxococcales bacterium]
MSVDEQLLDRWQAGDHASGHQLFARHFESLRRFFSSKTAEDVEDLLQQTFLALVEGRGRIRQSSSFRAYMFSVARRVLWARFDAKARNREDPGYRSAHDVLPSPSRHLATCEEERQLVESLRGLPLDQQIALELFYWEEMSASEIAGVLEVPEGTVRSRLRRARRWLARRLDGSTVHAGDPGSDELDHDAHDEPRAQAELGGSPP